jgi:glycosyltransferase involved in cell wall biosynthesis
VKILIVASWWPTPEEPAGGIFIEDQARLLARRHDVFVIAPDVQRWRQFPRWRLRSAPTTSLSGFLLARPVVHPLLPRHPRSAVPSFARAVLKAYHDMRATWGVPTLVHAHVSVPGGYAAARLVSEIGVPMVLTEHSWPTTLRLERRAEGAFAKIALQAATIRAAVSEPLAEAYRMFGGVDVGVVPNVVDTTYFDPRVVAASARESACRFTLIGRLAPRVKGVDIALRALALLPRDRTWVLRIAGDGPERADFERLRDELDLGDRVFFLGYLDRAGVRSLLGDTDFLVAPSRWETFGIVAVEAMAMGVPVIAAATGGLASILDTSTGVLVDVDNEVALRDVILDAIDGRLRFDPATIRKVAGSRFGVEAYLQRIDAVYAAALGSNP